MFDPEDDDVGEETGLGGFAQDACECEGWGTCPQCDGIGTEGGQECGACGGTGDCPMCEKSQD